MNRLKPFLFILITVSVFIGLLPPVFADDMNLLTQPVELNDAKSLFLDRSIITGMQNLTRSIVKPDKYPNNPVLVQEYPWEKRFVELYGSVLYDARLKKFRMWYAASENKEDRPEMYMCYAESDDGLHWEKPKIGTARHPKYDSHNIVLMDGHGLCVIEDRSETNPGKRFKGLGGNVAATSADGIHWATRPFTAAGKNDTSSALIRWNGEYLAFVRTQAFFDSDIRSRIRFRFSTMDIIREAAISFSRDFQTWSMKQTVVSTYNDRAAYPRTQPYGMSVTPYGDTLIGLIWYIDLDPRPGNVNEGEQFTRLAFSSDGLDWKEVLPDTHLLLPHDDTWESGRANPSPRMLTVGNEVRLYYTASNERHGVNVFGKMGIGVASWKKDRFVKIAPTSKTKTGVLQTVPIRIRGERLLINAEIGNGTLQVEIKDADGKIVPGFKRNASRLKRLDELQYEVDWKGKSIAGLVSEESYRLYFYLKNASLFAFHIPRPDTFQKPVVTGLTEREESLDTIFVRAYANFKKGQYENAIANFQKILAQKPDHGPSQAYLSMSYSTQNDFTHAQEHANQAFDLLPSQPLSLYSLFVLNVLHRDVSTAYEIINHAISLYPNVSDMIGDRGYVAGQLGKYEQAIEDHTRVIEMNPNDPYAYEDRAFSYCALGKYNEALADFNRAIQMNPLNKVNYLNRSDVYLKLNRIDDAIQDAEFTLKEDPVVANFILACAYSMKSEREDSVDVKKEYLSKSILYLQQALASGEIPKQTLLSDPRLNAVRETTNLQKLLSN